MHATPISFYQRGATPKALLIAVALIALIIGAMLQTKQAQKSTAQPEFERVILLPNPRSVSAFNLVDHRGNDFTLDSVAGKWSLLFFGFTHCPDICPTTLLTLKNIRNTLSANGKWPDLNIIMVSVDPDRDTVERLAQYVPFFHPEFTGVTGTTEAITQFAKELGILFVKREADESGFYDVDHSVSMVLLNPRGEYAGVITAPHEEVTLETDLAKLGQYLNISTGRSNAASEATTGHTEQILNPEAKLKSTPEPTLQITNAWVRLGPSNARSHAAYLEVYNPSSEPILLQAVESPVFNNSMIHTTVIEKGLAQMQHLENLTVPAKTSLTLEPMGKHLMLMGASRALIEGEAIPFVLSTDRGDVSFSATVQSAAKSK